MKSKYSILAAACLLLSISGAYAEIPTKEVVANAYVHSPEAAAAALTASEDTWFGLDFTYLKIFGDSGFKEAPTPLPAGWNELILNEQKKYDAVKTFGKKPVAYDFEPVAKRNKGINLDALIIQQEPPELTQQQIQKEVAALETGDTAGTGIVFMMESFSKPENQGYLHVVFFDIKTKAVLISARMSGKAGGFGKRNYWAKPVFMVMRQISDGVYKKLVKKYAK